MSWELYPFVAIATLILWLGAVVSGILGSKSIKAERLGFALEAFGMLLVWVFVAGLWISLERPPLRTLAETRLWHVALIPLCSLVIGLRWRLRWLRPYCLGLASVFLIINWVMPDTHDKTLMPALQSPWFVPHVLVYMIGYAFLAASAMAGVHGLVARWRKQPTDEILFMANQTVFIGFVFINLGVFFGGFWAKEAWGHYWSWDPKETWAFITWTVYLIYIHLVYRRRLSGSAPFLALILCFSLLLICWFGVNYLATSGQSVHTYSG
jgi:ABC-type transport system involved in cytochrome c biogenesis permease subunit